MSLRTRLRLVMLVVLLPGLAYSLIGSVLEHQRARTQAQAELIRLDALAAREEQQSLQDMQFRLALVAALDSVQAAGSGGAPQPCPAQLQALGLSSPAAANVAVWKRTGDLVCAGDPAGLPASAAQEPWFQRAIGSGAFSIGDFQTTGPRGGSTLTLGYPLADSHHTVLGVVSSSLDLGQLAPSILATGLPADLVLTVFDQNGLVLARSSEAATWVGQSLPEPASLAASLASGANVMERADVDGVVRLSAFAPITGPGGKLVYLSLGRPTVAVYGAVDTALIIGLALTAVLTLLAVLLAARWGRQTLEQPMQNVLAVADRLARGDLTARAQPEAASSEVDRLAGAVNAIARSLEQSERLRQQGEGRQHEQNEQLRRSQARATQLETVAAGLSRAGTPAEVVEVILRQGASALGAASATLMLLTDDELWLKRATRAGPLAPIDRLFQNFPVSSPLPAADVVRTGEVMWIESAAAYRARYPQLVEVINSTDYEAAVALPLRNAGRLIGVLMLSFPGELAAAADSATYLASLASLCALGLERVGIKDLML